MDISVVIPAFNEEKYIGACLERLVQTRTPAVREIIVVDNNSTDKTAEIAASFPGVQVVREIKKGTNSARHCGFVVASGDLVAFLDADVLVPMDWFDRVTRAFKGDHGLVGVSGPYDYYDLPWLELFGAHLYWRAIAVPTYLLLGNLLVAGNFVARRDALVATNGINPNIEFYGDDADIVANLRRVGKVKFSHAFFVWTSGRRILGEGAFKIGLVYLLNFVWSFFFHRTFTKKHKDIR